VRLYENALESEGTTMMRAHQSTAIIRRLAAVILIAVLSSSGDIVRAFEEQPSGCAKPGKARRAVIDQAKERTSP
jgi:hypothetical protein